MIQEKIEIPSGAYDSELKGWEYTIPESFTAEIKDGKIIVKKKEPELTDFEKTVKRALDTAAELGRPDNTYVKEISEELLELAQKELDIEKIKHLAWCEGNDQGYKDGKEDALMNVPKWKVADHEMRCIGDRDFVVKFSNVVGDSVFDDCDITDTVLPEDKYIDLYDVFKFLMKQDVCDN